MNFESTARTCGFAKITMWLCTLLFLTATPLQLLAQEKGFFFEISKGGKRAYIFGSSHAAGVLTYPLKPEAEAVLNRASCIALEVAPPDAQTMESITRLNFLPKGKKLGDLLAPEIRDRLKTFLMKHRYKTTTLDPYKPWVAAASLPFLAAKALHSRDFGGASKSLDNYLQERALAKKVPLFGIETVMEQFALNDSLTIQEQQALLIEALNSDESRGETNKWFAEQFRNGDIDALRERYFDRQSGIPEHGKAIAHMGLSRNETQATRIDEMVRSGRACIFAVGALHLGGEDGVVRLLEVSGYEVTQF